MQEADTELVRNVHCKMHALPHLGNLSPANKYSLRASQAEEEKNTKNEQRLDQKISNTVQEKLPFGEEAGVVGHKNGSDVPS